MKTKLLLIGLSLSASAFIGCSPIKKAMVQDTEAPVYEIAVRQVKDGMTEDFESARSAFIEKLTAQNGVSNDREFKSFYALPEVDKRDVYIGMTEYKTPKTPKKVQSKMGVVSKFLKFKKTMDLKAYVFVQPIEGGKFDLSSLAIQNGQILEVAVRRIKSGQETEFETARKKFVTKLDSQDGVVQSWEFKVVGGNDTEGLTVGMTVYENQEKFQAIAANSQTWPEAAFFGTFDPVALQYSISIK